MSKINRRRSKRVPPGKIEVTVVFICEGCILTGRLGDISNGGIKVTAKTSFLQENSKFTLALTLYGENEEGELGKISAFGEVVWRKKAI